MADTVSIDGSQVLPFRDALVGMTGRKATGLVASASA